MTSSPFEAFNRFEEAHGLPKDVIRTINSKHPETNAWAQFESNAIDLDEFDRKFADEALAMGYTIGGKQVLKLLSGTLRQEMVHALTIISRTLKTGCITNNVKSGSRRTPTTAPNQGQAATIEQTMQIFDVVIESSKVGMRKPDPRIYTLACDELGIAPDEAVFLDDLGINLKPARKLGMTTIKVADPAQALGELEQHLGMNLR